MSVGGLVSFEAELLVPGHPLDPETLVGTAFDEPPDGESRPSPSASPGEN
jgi:hypothetical protein